MGTAASTRRYSTATKAPNNKSTCTIICYAQQIQTHERSRPFPSLHCCGRASPGSSLRRTLIFGPKSPLTTQHKIRQLLHTQKRACTNSSGANSPLPVTNRFPKRKTLPEQRMSYQTCRRVSFAPRFPVTRGPNICTPNGASLPPGCDTAR